MEYNYKTKYRIQIVLMKVTLSILSLCGSIPELVGDTVEKFVQSRSRKNLERAGKRQKIVAAILKKPKKFFGISEDMILKFVSKQEFGAKVRTAVKHLTDSRHSKQVETTVFEFEDERLLRGMFIVKTMEFNCEFKTIRNRWILRKIHQLIVIQTSLFLEHPKPLMTSILSNESSTYNQR